jgi:hypothetical protein
VDSRFRRCEKVTRAWIRAVRSCRGRDAHYCAAPARIPTCGIPAPGSCLGSAVVPIGVRTTHAAAQPDQAMRRTRSPALCPVRALPTGLPSTRCLPSIPSAAGCSALFGDVESGEVGLIALPPPARSNGSCSFPASRFPYVGRAGWRRLGRIPGTRWISRTRPKSAMRHEDGYRRHAVFRHRLLMKDHSRRSIHPSSRWNSFRTFAFR